MREDTKAARRAQIERAAYKLLKERGYGGTSMLGIAKEAKASNETLYRWYGDKKGLFKTMVENNARTTKAALDAAIRDDADPLVTLEDVAPILLSMLLGERAISLNRAAASDESGELGATIAAGGRDSVFPLIEKLIQRDLESGALVAPSARIAADWFLNLLIGDLQIRRVIHSLPVPSDKDVRSRVTAAISAFKRLCST
ncbi:MULTISPECIES: TetR/AcrR family transcriptional regulator [unclassified Mesorhizobium]|uniref:TetR/AcrR family transcriptional regulator n=1 Tax=unclassified Mesorhizobium TaxID=325217 RepID=UPI0007EDE7C6|nr:MULTISPECIES: TetR/AcrR family transcriptional regulator [unclassified Mesorhizobium]RUV95977.1 TetR/AcrR family transcriptional regulator [Mesorhizobium sp. M5C.F.Ca.IN.020.14.1.1]QIA22253.1 TetR/AcrR family transcriptional regulator [Mesorhizobium sp. AA22]RUV30838.1 TetR/AcrR family transcriptional regulator [Mesorhizobium sp. M5C.F.Ca.IN.020.32.2.1]RWC41885.1 MAG: TetR/AcrR family transcriptional regulator [Mesorhizobium sp.]RWE60012.1 MAG: TetR/AcrR family transcriptional regulator [Me